MLKLANGDDERKGRAPSEADKVKIRAFVRKTPNLSDNEFHEFCERLGVDVHRAEEVAYAMARALAGGEAEKKKGLKIDPRQLAVGVKVEMEHTRDPRVAREIAADHLAEIPDYYTRLKKMEDEAMKKSAAEDLYYHLELNEDSRARMLKELARITDPEERKRYLADMSARNHPLAMSSPTMKTAAFDIGVAEGMVKTAGKTN